MDELRRQLNEVRRRREAVERQCEAVKREREAIERQREAIERQREAAERQLEKLNFLSYVEECHKLSLAIEIVSGKPLSTQGKVADPTDRVYPKRIIPWASFPSRQQKIFDQLSANQRFYSDRVFPNVNQLEYVRSNLPAISSEMDLRHFESKVVEIAVKLLVEEAYKSKELRASLKVEGSITFECHTNLGNQGPVNQFCVYRRYGDPAISMLAIEYKEPHKLSKEEVIAGLRGEIRPDDHIINKPRDDYDSSSRYLTAAVITQLFASMVNKHVQYGYVCTGETFIFLYISDEDISDVYYHVCVPDRDVTEQSPDRLYRTGVAQVLAFVLQVLRKEPPPQDWHQSASLNTWPDEREDVLADIPATPQKETRASPCKGRKTKFSRSQIRTRSVTSKYRQESSDASSQKKDKSEDEDEGPRASSSLSLRSRLSKKAPASTGTTAKAAKKGGTSGKANGQSQKRIAIKDRPFCTHKCLSGMVNHGPMDKDCPNIIHHSEQHITTSMFLDLIRKQLTVDRGRDADAMPLYVSGSVGALFKICLSSYGYTLVAKGVEGSLRTRLEHEERVYSQLRSIQGKYVPVCVGSLDLVLPYYYDGGVFEHFLFLSFAGKPLFDLPSQADKTSVVAAVDRAFQAIHNSCVLHRDAEPRNILYDAYHGYFMIVDFERSVVVNPPGSLSQNRKQKYESFPEQTAELAFARELQSVIQSVQRYIDSNATRSVL
ncbi:hypothetical protein F4679DRAFT_598549 [Xylaria curta]|nr:hypothetical protein F4679DRAFT_598549 [Xylaria curta]